MKKDRIGAAAALILVGSNVPCLADTDNDKKITRWFCDNLNANFDAETAIAAFPLERLGPTVTKSEVDSDHARITHSIVADGHDYRVEYHYSTTEKNVSEPYGLMMEAIPLNLSPADDPSEKARAWLDRFGKPVHDFLGWTVGTRTMPFGGELATKFSMWDSGYRAYTAQWFYPQDIAGFAELCAKAGSKN